MSETDYFSGFEVIRAAMEVEKNGHRFYSSMVEKAYTDLAREMFAMLAQDEVAHLQTLEKLAPKYQDGQFWENEAEFLLQDLIVENIGESREPRRFGGRRDER